VNLTDEKILAFTARAYRWLLRAYPPAFRQFYGAEMEQIFRESSRDIYRNKGKIAYLQFCLFAVWDFVVNVSAENYSMIIKGKQMMLRRGLDMLISLIGLWLTLPFFPIIAVLIKLTSPGPIFYVHQRVGKNGVPFSMYKLRSMTVDPPGQRQITSIGWFLRQAKLDEVPQLFNVLRGDMTIFGPRPILPTDVNLDDPAVRQTFSARPGLLGWS